MLAMIVFKQTLLPEPVDPPMSKCGIVAKSDEMRKMTDMQAERSSRLSEITTASAERAKKTASGAGEVVGITLEMQRLAANLTRQVTQFKISQRPTGMNVAGANPGIKDNPGE